MHQVRQLESLTENWLAPFPHLPDGVRKWLANNLWWLVVLASFSMAISVLVTLNILFQYISLGNISDYVTTYVAPRYTIGWLLTTLLALVYLTVATVLYAKAAMPLKEHLRLGWDILFIVLIIGAAKMFLDSVFTFNIFGFVFGMLFELIGLAIAAYFLFEIRSYFVKSGKVVKTVKK